MYGDDSYSGQLYGNSGEITGSYNVEILLSNSSEFTFNRSIDAYGAHCEFGSLKNGTLTVATFLKP